MSEGLSERDNDFFIDRGDERLGLKRKALARSSEDPISLGI